MIVFLLFITFNEKIEF